MELWIRSQDKEKMLKVDELSLIGMGGHKVGIGTFTKKLKNDDYCNYLGTYKDKKRALEVLDEIQNILMPKIIIRFDGVVKQDDIKRITKAFEEYDPIIFSKSTIEHLDTYVYEMPKE